MRLKKGSPVTLKGHPQERVGTIVSDCRGVQVKVKWEGKEKVMIHRLDCLESTQRKLFE